MVLTLRDGAIGEGGRAGDPLSRISSRHSLVPQIFKFLFLLVRVTVYDGYIVILFNRKYLDRMTILVNSFSPAVFGKYSTIQNV